MSKKIVYYLNGVSSSGKSSVCKILLERIKEPTIYLSLDNIHENLCDEYNNDKWKLYNQEVFGLHRTATVWISLGFNVIIDNVLEKDSLYKDARSVLPDAFYFGVFCSLETLLKREEERGRRDFNLVNFQYEKVHKNREYDLKLDSEKSSSEEMAEIILDYINKKMEK